MRSIKPIISGSIILFLNLLPLFVHCWNEWNYRVTWSEGTDALSKQLQWESIWDFESYQGDRSPPRPRRGHSLHLIKTDERSEFLGETYIVMFGGRDNDQKAEHIPRTYNVESGNGTVSFTTYDEKPVSPCNDPDGIYYTPEEQVNCNFTTASLIDIGLIYNDVWAYKLCNSSSNPPERDFDGPCNSTGWELWHPGAKQGGCVIELGIEVCTVPSERYNHGSMMFNDGALYVYGGFSQRCEDYCDDLWFFDIYIKGWREVYPAGKLTNFYTDIFFDETVQLDPEKVPIDDTTSAFAGPGRRWRHSMVGGEEFFDTSEPILDRRRKQQVAVFGGHRLWHGYSQENDELNNWENFITRPKGGYLDDLWIYTKYLDFSFPGQEFKANNGEWELKEPLEQCFSDPADAWETRFDISCSTFRPVGRGGHGSAFDTPRQRVWIFGGYTTYFPYLKTDGPGSAAGVTSTGSGGFVPYPGYQYFRNDLWYYDLKTSLWIEIQLADDSPVPDPRVDPIFLLLGDVIFMHGGFADNHIYGDTWYFNITSNRWLEKDFFVRPLYPANCTDDFEYIEENNCTELSWPKHLERDEFYPHEVLPYYHQPFYWPDGDSGPYYGIFPRGFSDSSSNVGSIDYRDFAPGGTPIFPYAATGLRQYAKPFVVQFNETHQATLYEYCTSVQGEPTRGRLLDGLYGRSNSSIFIPQPRPRKPGWDGCRDRADGRTDLPVRLQTVQPLPRYGHRAVFHPSSDEILFYGGLSYTREQPATVTDTWRSSTSSEMWYFNLFHCLNNCSNHGDCFYGFCECYVGFYGIDCSNTSCPGTFCYDDEVTHLQNCTHACQAGYEFTDYDTYVPDIYKVPCTRDNWGVSNGICDGFGSTMCAPPFIGDDCSIKDCKSNCSFNGYCSVEYPVSRCMCKPGYFGDICENKLCLNNCSYPNGECNTTSGECQCNMMYSPYNNTREFKPWAGEDCSYLFPYAGASMDPITQMIRGEVFMWIWVFIGFIVLQVVFYVNDIKGGD